MEFNSDQIAAIIGSKELELIMLRMEVARLRQYEPAPIVPVPTADYVTPTPIKETQDGTA